MVVVRGQEMIVRCPSYSHALKWARLECKSYKIPEPITYFPDDEPDDVPLFCTQIEIETGPGPIGRFAYGRARRFDGAMPALTRRRSRDAREESARLH